MIYRAFYPDIEWEMRVQIDESIRAHETCVQCVRFFLDDKAISSALDTHDGDFDKVFVEMLAEELLFDGFKTVEQVRLCFRDREGWPKLDGSGGITLLEMDEPDAGQCVVEMEEHFED